MYHEFYQLGGNGFRLTPDHRQRFAHPSYKAALEFIMDAGRQGEGFVILTGAPGTGKTTLVDELTNRLRVKGLAVARVSNTQVGAEELLRLLAFDLKLRAEGASKAVLLQRLKQHLIERRIERSPALLIIDEAQDLDPEAVEELRLITNFSIASEPLVQVLLVGQERLWDKLYLPELHQIHQRVIGAIQLKPLTATQTRHYLAHRLKDIGWAGDPCISTEAIARVHDSAWGIPRQINRIMNRLLEYGANAGLHTLEGSHAEEVLLQLATENLRPHPSQTNTLGVSEPPSTPPVRPLDALAAAVLTAAKDRPKRSNQTSTDTMPPPTTDDSPKQSQAARIWNTKQWKIAWVTVRQFFKTFRVWLWQTTPIIWTHVRDRAQRMGIVRAKLPTWAWDTPWLTLRRARARLSRRATPKFFRYARYGGAAAGMLAVLTLGAAIKPSSDSVVKTPAQNPNRAPNAAAVTQTPSRATPQGLRDISSNPVSDQPVAVQAVVANPKEPPNSTAYNPETKRRGSADEPMVPIVSGLSLDDAAAIPLANSGDLHLPPVSPAPARAVASDNQVATEWQVAAGNGAKIDPDASSVAPHTTRPVGPSSVANRSKAAVSTASLNVSASANSSKKLPPEAATTDENHAQVIRPDPKQRELLASAQRALREHRLTLPPNNNAFGYFQAVLARDPGNPIAEYGFVQIVRTYQQLAREKIENDDLDTAELLVNRGLKVIPKDSGLLAVAKQLKDLRSPLDIAE